MNRRTVSPFRERLQIPSVDHSLLERRVERNWFPYKPIVIELRG